ncbi:SapB/AmfS family lanthipeptide [Actinomadura sp. DC4]|nr:SapB/AmfS family lanthipeptide [Actinomadura sp. DC4]MDN3356905.1 SapB/AmfS family lanthipeptide [Actinomadura sp. DC4]
MTMALLDMQGMDTTPGGGGGGGGENNSTLSLLCHSSHSITICL